MVLGVERRRRWTDEEKLAILAEVGVSGWTVADVARRHDLTRQHIYQWRREMRRKGLWPETNAPSFLPVEIAPPSTETVTEPDGAAAEITVVLRNGRQLRCPGWIDDAALTRLVRLLETA
jgi:transposase